MEKFSQLFHRLSAAEAGSSSEHPEADELLFYHEGRLSEQRAEQVQAHLALCSECTRTILDLSRFPEMELCAPDHERTVEDEDADWLAIEKKWAVERLEDQIVGGQNPLPHQSRSPLPSPALPRTFHWSSLAAAIFLATTIGLLVQRQSSFPLSGQQLDLPRANIHFEEILPTSKPGVRSGNTAQILLPPEASSLVLILATEGLREHTVFEARIAGGSAHKELKLRGLVRARDGSFSLDLPRSWLSPGNYEVELSAIENEKQTSMAKFLFDLILE